MNYKNRVKAAINVAEVTGAKEIEWGFGERGDRGFAFVCWVWTVETVIKHFWRVFGVFGCLAG